MVDHRMKYTDAFLLQNEDEDWTDIDDEYSEDSISVYTLSSQSSEDSIPDVDNYIFCNECQEEYVEVCHIHGPLRHIPDAKINENEVGIDNIAKQTLPACLRIAESAIQNAGLGVWTTERIPARSYFGPYKGFLHSQPSYNGYGWQIEAYQKNNNVWYVDATDPNSSNWMRYVNCARNYDEQNLVVYQFKRAIYYGVLEEIPAHTELYVYYGDEYAAKLGIDVSNYYKVLNYNLPVKTFDCEACQKKFSSPTEVDDHASDCQKRVLRKFNGRRSNFKYTELSDPSDVDSDDRTHRCDLCPAKFKWPCTLRYHRNAHTGETPYKCGLCESAFSNPSSRNLHERTHTDEKPYSCYICNSKFKQLARHQRHMSIHMSEKSSKYDVREEKVYSDSIAENAPKHDYAASKPFYVCLICHKSFESRRSLAMHKRIHGVKMYSCRLCGMKLRTLRNLEQHMIRHEMLKRYVCHLCKYPFKQKEKLDRHMQVHTGHNLSTCDICGAKFRHPRTVVWHKRRMHS